MNELVDSMYYLSHLERDEQWGLVCTTVGSQSCGPDEQYPVSDHPSGYNFSRNGRVLDEYQLVYITAGQGWFKSDSTKLLRVCEGNMIIIFPGESHVYYPDENSGWSEMWVGFRGGKELDRTIGSFFDRNSPILNIGISDTVCDIYGRLLSLASSERLATQQAICGFVHALLGYVYYKVANSSISGNKNLSKIQHAQMLLRAGATSGISPAEVASKLGMSYSLLREQFKLLTGISMSDYIIRQRINLAKTLLTSSDKSIKEIAFEAGYDSISRFCCSFSQNVGMTASAFRKRNRH